MEHMCEAVRIQELLRILWTPSVTHPQLETPAEAQPHTPLALQLVHCGRHNNDDGQPRPESPHAHLSHI